MNHNTDFAWEDYICAKTHLIYPNKQQQYRPFLQTIWTNTSKYGPIPLNTDQYLQIRTNTSKSRLGSALQPQGLLVCVTQQDSHWGFVLTLGLMNKVMAGQHTHLRGDSNRSGKSLSSLSLATSAIAPNSTTGLTNAAATITTWTIIKINISLLPCSSQYNTKTSFCALLAFPFLGRDFSSQINTTSIT